MTTHTFSPDHYWPYFGADQPVLHVAPGDTIITTTVDAWGQDVYGAKVTSGPNPETGPFFVAGAEPGDTLVVHIERLSPTRETGLTRSALAANVIDPDLVRFLPANDVIEWRIDLSANLAYPGGLVSGRAQRAYPMAPMLGCLGVAPGGGQIISSATSGPHGGNMDYRGFKPGCTAYFPVLRPGALFCLGDGHALQGDGEIIGTGIETTFEVQFRLDLIKNKRIHWPRGENETHIFTIGNARPLEEALQHATSEMAAWLQEDYQLDASSAAVLMGMVVEYEVGNVFDPAYTMVCKVAKRELGVA
jgi:amidase